jgi:hypothetical protein
MSMVGFPLLLIPLAIYNIIVLLMPGVSLADPLWKLTLMSGAEWPLTLSDMLVALGIVLLLFEVIKGARPGAKFVTDHLLSLIIFGAAVAEFLLWPRFGTPPFFLLTLLALVDFLSGIALRVRRGMLVASGPAVSSRAAQRVEPSPVTEPKFDPAPEPARPPPAATSLAEAVPQDHPEPKVVKPQDLAPQDLTPQDFNPQDLKPQDLKPQDLKPQDLKPQDSRPQDVHPQGVDPDVTPAGSSPQVPSPGLQPGNGSPSSPDTPRQVK